MQATSNLYDFLDVRPDASPEEIREAYLRAKSAFKQDSVAVYSLMDPEESKDMIRKIEEAYEVLSHTEKRKEYDLSHGFLEAIEESKVVSIDRGEEILQSPSKTDIKPSAINAELTDQIEVEKEWSGGFLKKVRESKGISIEEMQSITRVSKTYLNAIENELFEKLPATVFTRGFVTQIAKTLKLPYERVVPAYIERFEKKK